MTLHEDPITSLALTPRRQNAALAALPWAEEEHQWQRQIVTSVLVTGVICFFALMAST